MEKEIETKKVGADLRVGGPEARRKAASVMGAASSPRKKASSAANGRLGGKRMTPMPEIVCACGAGDVTVDGAGHPLHPTTCPRGRVIRYRLSKGLPLT